jgi:hypothetical protein
MAIAHGVAIEKEELYGTWRLVSYTRQAGDGETILVRVRAEF